MRARVVPLGGDRRTTLRRLWAIPTAVVLLGKYDRVLATAHVRVRQDAVATVELVVPSGLATLEVSARVAGLRRMALVDRATGIAWRFAVARGKPERFAGLAEGRYELVELEQTSHASHRWRVELGAGERRRWTLPDAR